MNPSSLLHVPAELLHRAEPHRRHAGRAREWRYAASLVVAVMAGAIVAAVLHG